MLGLRGTGHSRGAGGPAKSPGRPPRRRGDIRLGRGDRKDALGAVTAFARPRSTAPPARIGLDARHGPPSHVAYRPFPRLLPLVSSSSLLPRPRVVLLAASSSPPVLQVLQVLHSPVLQVLQSSSPPVLQSSSLPVLQSSSPPVLQSSPSLLASPSLSQPTDPPSGMVLLQATISVTRHFHRYFHDGTSLRFTCCARH